MISAQFHAWIASALLAGAGLCAAQGTPEVNLTGTVTDAKGAALANAKVILLGRNRTAFTDAAGRYALRVETVSLERISGGMAGTADPGGSADARDRYSLTGRFLEPFSAPATPPFRYGYGSVKASAPAPDRGLPLRKSAEASAGTGPDTLSVVASGYARGERIVTALIGVQDFKLDALKYTDVPYKTGTLSAAEKTACLLDVHKPATGSKWPVVVHLHGGGMVEGDKTEGWTSYHNNFAWKFLDAGVMMVMPNYRLIGKGGTWPDYLRDAAAAAAWVRRNIEPYGGDPENVFISGWSAGAYLTQMLLLDTAWLAAAGTDAHRFRGFIALSGQTRAHANLQSDLKVSDIMAEKPYAMPMGHIRRTDVPFLLMVGGKEGGTIADNQELYDKLVKAGSADVAFRVIPDHAHNDMGNYMGNATDETRSRFLEFIQAYRKP